MQFKSSLARWLAVSVVTLACTPAWAILIVGGAFNGTDVGSADTLIGVGRTANSSLDTEMSFVNLVAGTSFTAASSEKICDGSAACAPFIFNTDVAGVFAINLADEPAYYLIKTGAGSSLTGSIAGNTCMPNQTPNKDCDHFVFQNLASLDWGVFTLGEMGFGAVTTISKISHIDQFGGTTTKVPEPGSLALLGAGLLALGVVRRRRPI